MILMVMVGPSRNPIIEKTNSTFLCTILQFGSGRGIGTRMFGGNSNQKPSSNQTSSSSGGAAGGADSTLLGEDRLFKRSNIVKDRDIEELGQKAASRANNDDTSKLCSQASD